MVRVCKVDEVFELDGATVQTVKIPGDDSIEFPCFDISKHPFIGGAFLAGGSAYVVVYVFDGFPATITA
jgi:hypothetical protein